MVKVQIQKIHLAFQMKTRNLVTKKILKNHFLFSSVSRDLNLGFSIWDRGKSWGPKSMGPGRQPLGIWGWQEECQDPLASSTAPLCLPLPCVECYNSTRNPYDSFYLFQVSLANRSCPKSIHSPAREADM